MSGGKYASGKRTLPLTEKQLALGIPALVLVVLALLCAWGLHRSRTMLITQSAAQAWRGESDLRFAQVSVFLPNDTLATEDHVYTFRQALESAFVEASLEAAEGGSLYTDAYAGKTTLNVQSERASVSVQTLGVGGEFFLFHPLRLLSGSYLSERDFMQDRVLLDENLAWSLFGSSDVVGQTVTIQGREYPVAGVVALEDDPSTKKARTAGEPLMFMCYDALNALTQTGISSYELVAPNMVSGYALGLVEEKFQPTGGVVVENSRRFSAASLGKIVLAFGTRSMNEKGVIYPYWENAARRCEDYAALYLLLMVLFLTYPVVLAVVVLARLARHTAVRVSEEVTQTVEQKIEENKEKHYVRTGI